MRSRPSVRQFLSFFSGSLIGLAIDLGGFAVLAYVGVAPWLANGISSFVSISAVYLFVSNRTFESKPGVPTYIAFVVWYSVSILTFSALIQYCYEQFGGVALAWKLLFVPLSFLANYAFSRVLFRARRSQA